MTHYIQPTWKRNPGAIHLHIGTNNQKEAAEETANDVLELAVYIKTEQNKVAVHLIIKRGNDLSEKAHEVNNILYSHCKDYGIQLCTIEISPVQFTNLLA